MTTSPDTDAPQADPSDPLAQILADLEIVETTLEAMLPQMQWANEEIAAAQERHPAAREQLHASFLLLKPTNDLMRREMPYRAHCREILERVATGGDTRPATAIEVLGALARASARTPLNTAATGLYFRMWKAGEAAGLPDIGIVSELEHYEAIAGTLMDEYEHDARTRLAQPARSLTPVPAAFIAATAPTPEPEPGTLFDL
ncbi:hypothetical protein AB0L82_36015 [Nocardia sp. NPDC052001]|uniref:hypothetical protein n=1 Tax=Nocardia sp. NPDC052001 TaxID=3154853 RepID=UPI0034344032